MTRLTFFALALSLPLASRAAIIGGDCAPKTPELKLARACYGGAMSREKSELKYLGEIEANGNTYCQNTLFLTSKIVPPSIAAPANAKAKFPAFGVNNSILSTIQAVKDDGGQLRVHNYVVSPGRPGFSKISLAGLPSVCVGRAKIDHPCSNADAVKVTYAGTPGSEIKLGQPEPDFAGSKAEKEFNQDQSKSEIARKLVEDVDRRLPSAAASVNEEARGPRPNAGKVKQEAEEIWACYEQARELRKSYNLLDPKADDSMRKDLLAKLGKTGAAPPTAAPGSGAGTAK